MFFQQANETQDPSDMSDPSEVNQPHPVSFVQGPGRYIQLPYYVPVSASHIYPNYPVDPNPAHWYPVSPYGNAPMINGRQLENESNVEDERGAASSFPSPDVGLPPTSTMQQRHVYQMVPPLSNLYAGSIPSGVNYVNSPIPYPAPYATSLATGAEPPNTPQSQPNSNRVGVGGTAGGESGGGGGGATTVRNSGKNNMGGGPGGAAAKLMSDKQATANESSMAAAAQDTNGNDPSASTLPPTSMPLTAAAGPPPPYHQHNFMPLGPVQYSYPYFPPTGPSHLTSAQHATGSPIYIPHPSTVPIHHNAPIYNSGPTAVFSADNGISQYSTVVPVPMPPSKHYIDMMTLQQQQLQVFLQYTQRQHQQPPPPPPPSSTTTSSASASSATAATAVAASSCSSTGTGTSTSTTTINATTTISSSSTSVPQSQSASSSSNTSHENESGVNFNVEANTTATAAAPLNAAIYKNSNLLADSAPFEPESKKIAAVSNYSQSDASSVAHKPVVSSDGSTLPDDATVISEPAAASSGLAYAVSPSGMAESNDSKSSCSLVENEKNDNDRTKCNIENVTSLLMNDLRVIDGGSDEMMAEDANDSDKIVVNDITNVDLLSGARVESDGKATDVSFSAGDAVAAAVSSSYSSSSSVSSSCCSSSVSAAAAAVAGELVNGKTSSSPGAASSCGYEASTAKGVSSADAKSGGDLVEEQTPLVTSSSKKSWASLFKETPPASAAAATKSKTTAAISYASPSPLQSTTCARNVASETFNSSVSSPPTSSSSSSSNAATSVAQHHAVENASNKSSYAHSSPLNGVPYSLSSAHRSKATAYKLSSPSLADDTVLPKIGELMKNYKLDHRAVNIEPRGLENKSNYCYINAILQALLACPPFYNLMKFISTNLHHHKTKLATKQHLPIIDSVVQFVEEFKLVPQKGRRGQTRKLDATPQEIVPGKPFEPGYMYNMLSVLQNNSSFVMGQQEDAQEFLTCLLNGLNDEMVELIQLADGVHSGVNNVRKSQLAAKSVPVNKNHHHNNNNNNNNTSTSNNNKKISNGDIGSDIAMPDDSDSEWKQVHPKIKPHRPNLALTRTPLSDIFRGQMRSVLAKIGDQCTSTIEPFFTLHLNIEKVNSVKQALELLPGRDNLEGVTSSRTNQEVDAYQQQYLEELPYVLLLHLKYFDYKHHTCRKIKKSIEFPIDLKLDLKLFSTHSPLQLKTASSKSRQYKLFAVVYHDGNEATKGHYITDVFHIGYGGWVRYDDARVWTVSENEVLKPDLPRVPYLLYYRRCDTIAALMQPPFEKRM